MSGMLEKIKLSIYKYKIKKYSDCYFNNVYISKLENEFHHLDYLLQCENELVVVKCYDYEGNIYGAENISEWTQAISYSGYKFENPLRELKEICDLLAKEFADKTLVSYAVFADKCVFPKAMPANVIHRSTLLSLLKKRYKPGLQKDCSSLEKFIEASIRT